jgi:hypothetical protein
MNRFRIYASIIMIFTCRILSAQTDTNPMKYSILHIDSIKPFFKEYQEWGQSSIAMHEIIILDSLLNDVFLKQKSLVGRNKDEYQYQVVVMTNPIGEKMVWLNAFCASSVAVDWHERPVLTKGGGNCYFRVMLNLSKGVYSNFIANGLK